MKLKYAYVLLLATLIITSCGDDDGPQLEVVPPRLLSEVAAEDDAEIVEFLKTHFYNAEEFQSPPAGFDFKIRFDTIAGENSTKQSIFDSPFLVTETVTVESSDFGLDGSESVNHKLYTLVVREGEEDLPTIGDYSILQYEGLLLDGELFDASSRQPARFYLADPTLRVGFARAMLKLRTGTGPVENNDGTISYENYGIGAVFIPSGLAYFNQSVGSIPAYTPLVFKLDALDFEPNTDFDGDGIPSILEDVNGNGDLNDDNTDADSEPSTVFLPNHNDTDDDNDGIPTREEIDLDANGNFVGFRDTDGDGVPDHLDNDL